MKVEVKELIKKISAIKARQNLGELLEEVFYKNDHFMITRRDKAMAVVIPIEEYERLLAQREEDFAILEEVRSLHEDIDPDEVEKDVADAIKHVRQQA